MSAQVLTQFVTDLFSPLSETILARGGTIDKYIGDSVMAFWNAPLEQRDHAERACRAALGMLRDLKSLNERLARAAEQTDRPFRPVSLGIGFNTGRCCVGNFGSAQRFDYSALGNDVNLASRFEALTKAYGLPIVIGERTAKEAAALAVVEIDRPRIRGYQRATPVYALLGDEDDRATAQFKALSEQLDLMLAAFRALDFWSAQDHVRTLEIVAPELSNLWRLCTARIGKYSSAAPDADWAGSLVEET